MAEALSLRGEIHRDILNGQYECVVCYEKIHTKTPIWSCGSCFRVIDLKCVRTWYERTNKPDGSFNCPHCRTPQKKTRLSYRCWCKKEALSSKGKMEHVLDDAIPPHSCGQTCGAKRDCPHPCPLICHAGPHLPSSTCMHLGPKIRCFCGKHTEQKPCAQTQYGGFSCGDHCGRVNKVCGHNCSRPCHPINKQSREPCHPCEQPMKLTCFCQKLGVKIIPCHEISNKERRSVHARDHKTISCGNPCGKIMNCGNHYCQHACHHGNRNREFHICPLTPFPGETCFCGKLHVQRKSCLDPKVSCKSLCEKKLECGHLCQEVCHEGACPPCAETLTDVSCRCERTTQTAFCGQLPYNPPLCTRKCGSALSCGRHHCSQECCPFNPIRMHNLTAHRRLLEKRQLGIPTGSKKSAKKQERIKSLGVTGASNPDAGVVSHHRHHYNHHHGDLDEKISEILNLEEIARITHICQRICGRSLNCKIHTCSLICHTGPCSPCLSASFEEWVCPCGRTKVLPPIRCGTALPACSFQCHRPQSCGHRATHLCHSDEIECPPCTEVVKKSCLCGKQMLNTRCSAPAQRCATPCGNKLECGHSCQRLCCSGTDCGPCEAMCDKTFPGCGHRHQTKCHFPHPCPSECDILLYAKCPCGTLTVTYECGEDLEVYCNETCIDECYHDDLIEAFDSDRTWIGRVESKVSKFVSETSTRTLWFQPMSSYHRKLVHLLLSHYGIKGESVDSGKMRSVCGRRTDKTHMPKFRLSNAPRKKPQVNIQLPQDLDGSLNGLEPPEHALNALEVGGVDAADSVRSLIPNSKPSNEVDDLEERKQEKLKAELRSKLRSFEVLME